MIDLIAQGYSGNDLREHFREEVERVHLMIRAMLADAEKIVGLKQD